MGKRSSPTSRVGRALEAGNCRRAQTASRTAAWSGPSVPGPSGFMAAYWKVQAALDIHLSAAALLQYNSTVDQVNANIRFRYHFREGSDLWLVYNDAVNTERDILGRPQLPFSQGRNLMLKYTYTFTR